MAACATAGPASALPRPDAEDRREREELRSSIRTRPDGRGQLLLSVPSVRCGQCIAVIERALAGCAGVVSARVNLTLRRVDVTLAGDADPLPVLRVLDSLGHPATPVDPGEGDWKSDPGEAPALLRAAAVAGFGAMNVMLLSVAIWAGAEGATRETFHALSALIALPVVAYAGRPFFVSAWGALRAGRLNMDVPIALAVLLALALSLAETAQGGGQVFYDAAVTLLFFLLVGRYLDHLMRDRARNAVTGLARLAAKGAMAIGEDGAVRYVPLDRIAPGMLLSVAAGERVPVDVRVERGASDLDRALVTGESDPVAAGPGDVLEAGTLNLTGALEVRALRPAGESFLAETMRMLEAAERGRGRYVRIADRAARLYAPVVHLMALATFVGWIWTTGDWRGSLFVAISVLIITCPCALALAVPVAHVAGAGRLLRAGVMMKDGAALERLAGIDRVAFDKTGTLTTGARVTATTLADAADRAAAGALARVSTHPAARAVAEHLAGTAHPSSVEGLREVPGHGVEGVIDGRRARLGRADWVAEIAAGGEASAGALAFAFEGATPASFAMAESLRPGAKAAVADLCAAGLEVEILSGDSREQTARIARELGITRVRHGARPADKVAHLERLRAQGRRVLMVGDGLNDAAALAAAHVSMAPASASDAGRRAADFVFTGERLDAVPLAHAITLRTAAIVRQNFGLAVAYNCIAIPLAVAGQVTPLIAALAMSASSILVVANSMRLNGGPAPAPETSRPAHPELRSATA